MKFAILVIAFMVSVTAANGQWVKQTVATNASLRGLSVVSRDVVWASGTKGTVLRTIDGGTKWDVIAVPGAEKLDLRDIEAFDRSTAYALSIGNGEDSRIFKTSDGGKTWKEQFRNSDPKRFFDALACWDRERCIAMSDPVEGHFRIIRTDDGGEHWKDVVSNKMPAAKDGEAAFAASGTCLTVRGSSEAYLVSGGADARVFHSVDRGTTWTPFSTPIVKGSSGAGIFSIAMKNASEGVIVGGNYEKPTEAANSLAFTRDGGKTWQLAAGLSGYRSAVAYIDAKTILAVGTSGTDISYNGGKDWKNAGSEKLNAAAAKGKQAVWAVGESGGVYKWK